MKLSIKKTFACLWLLVSTCCFAQPDPSYELTHWSFAGSVVEGREVTLSNTLCLPDTISSAVSFSVGLFQPASDWILLDENNQPARDRSFALSPGECQILTLRFKARALGETAATLRLDCPGYEAPCDQVHEIKAQVIRSEDQVRDVEQRVDWQGTFTVAGARVSQMFFYGEDELRIGTGSILRRFRLSRENPDLRYLGSVAMDQAPGGDKTCNLGTSLLDYDSVTSMLRIRSVNETIYSYQLGGCFGTPRSDDVRVIENYCPLGGVHYALAGRLELRHEGVWGSFCSDSFMSENFEKKACAELGYDRDDAEELRGCGRGSNETYSISSSCPDGDLYLNLTQCIRSSNRANCPPGHLDLGVGCQYQSQVTGCADNDDFYLFCPASRVLTKVRVAERDSNTVSVDSITLNQTAGTPLAILGLAKNLLAIVTSSDSSPDSSPELGIHTLEDNELRESDSQLTELRGTPLIDGHSARIYLGGTADPHIARFDIIDGRIAQNIIYEIPGLDKTEDFVISPQGLMVVLSEDGRSMQILKESSVSAVQASSLLVTVMLAGLALFKAVTDF